MSKDFKEVLIILYDKFGDDLINCKRQNIGT